MLEIDPRRACAARGRGTGSTSSWRDRRRRPAARARARPAAGDFFCVGANERLVLGQCAWSMRLVNAPRSMRGRRAARWRIQERAAHRIVACDVALADQRPGTGACGRSCERNISAHDHRYVRQMRRKRSSKRLGSSAWIASQLRVEALGPRVERQRVVAAQVLDVDHLEAASAPSRRSPATGSVSSRRGRCACGCRTRCRTRRHGR